MTPSALIRASGLATIVGGIFFALFPILHPDHTAAGYTSWIWVPAHMMPNVGAILVLFGLTGLLVRQLERAGLFGVAAFVIAFIGTASFVMGAMIEAFIIPYMGLQSPEIVDGPPPPGVGEAFLIITSLFALGYLLLGIATYRAGVLPRSVGTLLIVGAVADTVLTKLGAISMDLDFLWVLGPVLLGAGLAWLGYALWNGTPRRIGSRQIVVRPAHSELATNAR
ncbi:MAG TPA: hypothetical protein VFH48_22515 [Chloroflexota bacterium]|nr:hypothetical protein [Chloroflexota bacterium]